MIHSIWQWPWGNDMARMILLCVSCLWKIKVRRVKKTRIHISTNTSIRLKAERTHCDIRPSPLTWRVLLGKPPDGGWVTDTHVKRIHAFSGQTSPFVDPWSDSLWAMNYTIERYQGFVTSTSTNGPGQSSLGIFPFDNQNAAVDLLSYIIGISTSDGERGWFH